MVGQLGVRRLLTSKCRVSWAVLHEACRMLFSVCGVGSTSCCCPPSGSDMGAHAFRWHTVSQQFVARACECRALISTSQSFSGSAGRPGGGTERRRHMAKATASVENGARIESPRTPPPRFVQPLECSPGKVSFSESEHIRAHGARLQAEYDAWLKASAAKHGGIHAFVDGWQQPMYGGAPPSESSSGRADHRRWHTLDTMVFMQKEPDLCPTTESEWMEFERRCWWLRISLNQGLTLRRAHRRVGVRWP